MSITTARPSLLPTQPNKATSEAPAPAALNNTPALRTDASSLKDKLIEGPRRIGQAALEIPKAVAYGAAGGVAVVGLPALLVPPLLPFFAPFIPLGAFVGGCSGFTTGAVNALGRLVDGEKFKPIR